MTIGSGNIKLMKSEVLLDTVDGGGQQTSVEVVDGVSNNLFPDVSELDRVYGRVSLRKTFLSVVTDDTDSYYGSHMIVSKKPEDPRVSTTIFDTKDWFDRRAGAKDKVERYLARGPKWAGHVLEQQLTGQRAIQQCVRVTDPEPKVGQGVVLTIREGLSSELEQYVRITKVSSEVRLFTVAGKDIERKVLTIEISDPLRYDFQGPTVAEYELGSDLSARANLRDTRVANAANYYGISKLALSAVLNDAAVNVESIFTQLVPASQAETPLLDLNAAGLVPIYAPSATSTITRTGNAVINPGARLYLGSPIFPGSFTLTHSSNNYTESGGDIKLGGATVGRIEYDKGLLVFLDGTPSINSFSGYTVTFKPAALPTRSARSTGIRIDQGNRGFNYTASLLPIPSPGSTVVSYMAQGKVYYLYDTGANGILKGSDSSFGAGTVSFTTGTVLITLGVQPDAGTDIIFNWAEPVSTFIRSGITVAPAKIFFQLAHQQVTPSNVTVTWLSGVTTKTATDDGLGGFTGDATGQINYAKGEFALTPTLLPAIGATFTVAYQWGAPNEQLFVAPSRDSNGYINVTLPNVGGSVVPGSVEVSFQVNLATDIALVSAFALYQQLSPIPEQYTRLQSVALIDALDTVGGTVGSFFYQRTVFASNPNNQQGLNYSTRVLKFHPGKAVLTKYPIFSPQYRGPGGFAPPSSYYISSYFETPFYAELPTGADVKVRWRTNSANTSATETFTASELRYDLTPGYGEDIVPGSARFTVGGREYIDRAGSLYHTISQTTGSGTFGGSLGYQNGIARITDWVPGAANTVALTSLSTELNLAIASSVIFRTPIVPVRPGSVQVRAIAVDGPGTEFNFSIDNTGNTITSQVNAKADYTSGVVTLNFGIEVQITAGNRTAIEAKRWWLAASEYTRSGNTYIFEPKPVYANSLKYSAISYTYLPLSSDILGLDPVRLPSDGRVPIFNLSTVVVVHQTATPTLTPTAVGTVFTTGQVRCAYIKLVDTLGVYLPESMYTTDLNAGTITLGASFSTSGRTLPILVEHRIEDMGLVTDVQINGRLGLNKPLTHAYSASSALVSSALLIADLQARAFNEFSQGSWTSVWSDTIIGSPIASQYNKTDNPIVVTNKGALEEDWALIFTGVANFRIVGKNIGEIGTGSINNADNTITGRYGTSPVNPKWNVPYFMISQAGWGGGWAAGNVFRFKTAAANHPVWIARTVLQGDATTLRDSFKVQLRGDVNTI